jgi:hypothetical protein
MQFSEITLNQSELSYGLAEKFKNIFLNQTAAFSGAERFPHLVKFKFDCLEYLYVTFVRNTFMNTFNYMASQNKFYPVTK